MEVIDLGLMPYDVAWDLQHKLQRGVIDGTEGEKIILVEHPDVITLGRHAKESNLLLSRDSLAKQGVGVFDIERGGDVTYHGPGQLVVYPIINLTEHRLGVKKYVDRLEEAVIHTIASYGLKGKRVEGATGVWLGKGNQDERKICAIGVKCSRFVTMHGLGLNVNTDLSRFGLINPCGFIDKGVTSIARELGHIVDMAEVKRILAEELRSMLK